MEGTSPETILILAANPRQQRPLRLDIEVREIQNGLRHSRKKFDVRQQWAIRTADLRRALLDYRPAYVHFCGHGSGEDGIALEDHLVSADALGKLFALFSSSVKCVVLNACYSIVQARVIAEHIDFVVGMDKRIGDTAAIEFATAFYDALGAGETIEFAYALGCNAIQMADIPEYLTPALLTRSRRTVAIEAPSKDSLSNRYDWDGAPDVSMLFGREAVAEVLKRWILDDLCKLILITGLGGVGKTDLVTCLGRGGNHAISTSPTLAQGIQHHFERVLWRKLINAPPPQEFFADILSVLSDHRHVKYNPPPQQASAILSALQTKRCLLILDNVESLLEPGDPAMRYRDGYEEYGLLFEHIGRMAHKSCLVLTSREKPKVIAELEGIRRPVRSLSLNGIGKIESQQLFSQIGDFTGNDDDWEQIVKIYNGNPLALEFAARHVAQVFGGNLATFLEEGRSVFSNLKDLLDWHLDRLSEEETELAYWLAIEREPISLATLYDNLALPASRELVTSTLQNLQRRIPLERTEHQGFTLQPVLIEHITARIVDRACSELGIQQGEPREHVGDIAFGAGHRESTTRNLHLLSKHSLVKATAKEVARDSQKRLILDPIAQCLTRLFDHRELRNHLVDLLAAWRRERKDEPSYIGGNIINLLAHLGLDLSEIDFSRLRVWQACLDEVNLHSTDFSFSEFWHCTFKHAFGPIFCLCYSPDGRFIAAGDDSGEVWTFHSASGQMHLRCYGHSDVVSAVAFSPDGQTLASSSYDHTIRLWRTDDGECLNTLLGHQSWVYSIAFSPDGQTIASCGEDGTVRLWDLSKSGCQIPVSIDNGFVSAVAFSPDGTLLAFGGSEKSVAILRLSDFKYLAEFRGHSGKIRALSFSPDGAKLASGAEEEDSIINIWQINIDRPVETLKGHSGTVRALSFRNQGDLLVSAGDDQTVRVWKTNTGECVGSMHAANGRIWAACFSPMGDTFATGSEDSTITVWDSEYCDSLVTLRGYGNKIWALAFGADKGLLVSGSEDKVVRVWDTLTMQVKIELRGHTSRIWSVACSADKRWIASASDDLTVRLWDLHRKTCLYVLHGHRDWIRAVSFSGDSSLLASAGEDGLINIWDLGSGSCRMSIESGVGRVFSMAFCRESGWLAVAGAESVVNIFSPENGSLIKSFSGHNGSINSIFSCADSLLASCGDDGTINVWDLTQLKHLYALAAGSRVWCGASCSRDRLIASGSADGVLRIWSLEDGAFRAEMQAHQGSIWTLAISADDEAVATSGDDGAIRLWKLADIPLSSSPVSLRPPRPYEGMNITGSTGITSAQKEVLEALGAIEMPVY